MPDRDDLLVQLDLKDGTIRLHANEHLLAVLEDEGHVFEQEATFPARAIRRIHGRDLQTPFFHFFDDRAEILFRELFKWEPNLFRWCCHARNLAGIWFRLWW